MTYRRRWYNKLKLEDIEVVKRCGNREMQAVIACYIEGMTAKEAARKFGITEAGVVMRLRKANKTL